MKEHHELVMAGPYAYVRHPIYAGVLLAAFGTALTGTVCEILSQQLVWQPEGMSGTFVLDLPEFFVDALG